MSRYTGNGAPLIIGAQDDPAEHPIPNYAGHDRGDAFARFIENKRRAFVPDYVFGRRNTRPWQKWVFIRQARRNDAVEIGWRWAPHRCLSTARNTPRLIQHTAFDRPGFVGKRNGRREVRMSAGRDQRRIHSRRGRIGNHALHFSYRVIAFCARDLAQFAINDPIPKAGFCPLQILYKELIAFRWSVGMDRVNSVMPKAIRVDTWPPRQAVLKFVIG